MKIELTDYIITSDIITSDIIIENSTESTNYNNQEPEPELEPLTNNAVGFKYYGNVYNNIYLGSNGYITFLKGDTSSIGTLETHLSEPRLSFLFTDLNLAINTVSPTKISKITYGYFDDISTDGNEIYKNSILSINFLNICDRNNFIKDNTVQVLLYLENSNLNNRGKIIVNYQKIGSSDGIVGLSNGYLPITFSNNDIKNNQIF